MARACCAALGGFAVPAADRGFVGSEQHEDVTVLSTLLFAGFGKLSNSNAKRGASAVLASICLLARMEVRKFAPIVVHALRQDSWLSTRTDTRAIF